MSDTKPTSNKQNRAKTARQKDARKVTKARAIRLPEESPARMDFEKSLQGSIKADLTKQLPSNSYGLSFDRMYYRDQPFDCLDCGKQEIWTAAQQKWYFEVAKGPIYDRAVRCRNCRQKRKRGSLRKKS